MNAPGAGKKAVHVKWAGKTIALGTFPSAEADEKCARAKALTRAWRSTMRPKPSRDWVMLELERLGVRVVSGRLGRKAGEEGDDTPTPDKKGAAAAAAAAAAAVQAPPGVPPGGAPMPPGGPAERKNSMGWGATDADITNMMARRNSSLGLSMMNDTLGRRGSLSSLGQMMGLDGDPNMPPHRPLVGGGAAAAYEALRHDHFTQKSAEQQRRASSLGLGTLTNGGLGGTGMSVNPNQHYEMLKLHHMNLLNEIQETTLMMNLYQQQQLQQQQQQLQQQATAELTGGGGDSQINMLMQQQSGGAAGQGLDPLFGASQLQQRGSLGLGGGGQLGGFGGGAGVPPPGQGGMQGMPQQQPGGGESGNAAGASAGSSGTGANNAGAASAEVKKSDSTKAASPGTGTGTGTGTGSGDTSGAPDTKRSADGDDAGSPSKRQKADNAGAGNGAESSGKAESSPAPASDAADKDGGKEGATSEKTDV